MFTLTATDVAPPRGTNFDSTRNVPTCATCRLSKAPPSPTNHTDAAATEHTVNAASPPTSQAAGEAPRLIRAGCDTYPSACAPGTRALVPPSSERFLLAI